MNYASFEYRKAFELYLRKGVPIIWRKSGAQEGVYYIWHTQGDDNVRLSHQENNGRIFSWGNPPETGNPGEDYNCRCWAEPVLEGADLVVETYYRYLWSLLTPPWDVPKFVLYFYIGFGRRITLRQVGHLEKVIKIAERDIYTRVEEYFRSMAMHAPIGVFTDTFNNSYDFSDVNFVHGHSRIDGEFVGEVTFEHGKRILHGKVYYKFSDVFTDVFDKIEMLSKLSGIDKEKIPEILKILVDFPGVAYPIVGDWSVNVSIEL